MLFSSLSFLYVFLPAVLMLYALAPARLRNAVLLLTSLLFYFCGEPKYTLLILGETLFVYAAALLIARTRTASGRRALLGLSLLPPIGALLLFKYADLGITAINAALGTALPLLRLALPIGISFYTFQQISYLIDVYRNSVPAERNPLRLAVYVTLFPQLIAGPIVRYGDVAAALRTRGFTLAGLSEGLARFTLGLAKKVLLANVLGELVSACAAAPLKSVLGAWLIAVGYTLQIYFDFSGYSDMAIGLGRMFGFSFPENFHYPYTARSVTDFWRRWHMTLSGWFRDYVYIPLGGNRRSPVRQILNIFVVWTLTGLWHGASWVFAAWGLYFALLLTLEKGFLLRWLARLPRAVGHIYALLAVVLGFVLFQSDTFSDAARLLSELFGAAGVPAASPESLYALRSYALMLLLSCLCATPVFRLLAARIQAWPRGGWTLDVLRPAALLSLLVLCTAYLADGSFNPFLYFRF